MASGRLTIVDIAKMAGVSRSTVSRAINNDSGISEETKEKIMEVIRSVNFRPNVNARRTVKRSCDCLGLYIGSRVLIRDANARVLSGVIEKCNEVSYDLVLRSSCSIDRLLDMYSEQKVDGFIILNPYPHDEEMLRRLEESGIPYACTAVCDGEEKYEYVDTDNRKAAYEAVAYLIAQGHRRIACLTETDCISSVALREAGYRECMRDHGLAIPDNYLVYLNSHGQAMDMECLHQALDCGQPPTAFFALSDEKAMRALLWLRDHHYRVPEDISIIGFDDLPEAISNYPLTTVKQDFYGRGYIACQNVLSRISGEKTGKSTQILLPYQLVERATVAPPKE